MLDLVIRSGLLVDGTGSPGTITDVGIAGDRVAATGDLSAVECVPTLDATGLVVAPGFVDIHSHSDFTLLVDPRAQSSIAQGVTTEVIGNCGHGCAPIFDPAQITGNIYGYVSGVRLDWSSTADYLERLTEVSPAVNVVPIVPNGNLRIAAMGMQDRAATSDELRDMAMMLEEGLEAGAFGYSTGLEYPSERATTEDEAVYLCAITARAGGLYTTHTRNRDILAVEAVEEAIRVAARADIPLQISHITPRKGGPPDSNRRAIESVDRALKGGQDIAFDMHTRLYGFTNLSAALPPSVSAGDPDVIAGRLQSEETRRAVREFDSLIASFGRAGWDRVELFSYPADSVLVGKSIAELTSPDKDPMNTVVDLLAASADDLHAPMCVCHSYSEDELLETYQHPVCTLGSDATALGVDGPLAGSAFPGAFTWASWFFRRFVRERHVFSLEEGVRKLSSDPARRFGLKDRGMIRPGSYADVAIFNADEFAETGTMNRPNQLALGMKHVLVNGVLTWTFDRETGQRGGRVLKRQTDMETRN